MRTYRDGMYMHRTTVTIPEYNYREVQELAQSWGKSVSEVLQDCLIRGIREFKPEYMVQDPETGSYYVTGGPKMTLEESIYFMEKFKQEDEER